MGEGRDIYDLFQILRDPIKSYAFIVKTVNLFCPSNSDYFRTLFIAREGQSIDTRGYR